MTPDGSAQMEEEYLRKKSKLFAKETHNARNMTTKEVIRGYSTMHFPLLAYSLSATYISRKSLKSI